MGRKSGPSTETSTPNKVFGVRMEPELVKKLKILAVKKETQLYKLLEEAIVDLLKKHKEL
jgi:predicted transcriptional regulator